MEQTNQTELTTINQAAMVDQRQANPQSRSTFMTTTTANSSTIPAGQSDIHQVFIQRQEQASGSQNGFRSKNLRDLANSKDLKPLDFDETSQCQRENGPQFFANINYHIVLNNGSVGGQDQLPHNKDEHQVSTGLLSWLNSNHIFRSSTSLSLRTNGPRNEGINAMYIVEIHTPFSRRILKRSFQDFVRLQKILMQLGHVKIEHRCEKSGKLQSVDDLKNYLPPLPRAGRQFLQNSQNQSVVQKNFHMSSIKDQLSAYCIQILRILDHFYFQTQDLKSRSDQRRLRRYLAKKHVQFMNTSKLEETSLSNGNITPQQKFPELEVVAETESSKLEHTPSEVGQSPKLVEEIDVLLEQEIPEFDEESENGELSQDHSNTGQEKNLNSSQIFVGDDEKQSSSKSNQKVTKGDQKPHRQKDYKKHINALEIKEMERFYSHLFLTSKQQQIDKILSFQEISEAPKSSYVAQMQHLTRESKPKKYMLDKPAVSDPLCWAYETMQFFELEKTFAKEHESALKLQSFFKQCKKIYVRDKWMKIVYQLKGMLTNITNLPQAIIIKIFSFLQLPSSCYKMKQVCKYFRECSMQPCLRKDIKIDYKIIGLQKDYFSSLMLTSNQLQILSIKHCPNLNKEILSILNLNLNPFSMRELYLDGCEGLTDDALECLQMNEEEKEFESYVELMGWNEVLKQRRQGQKMIEQQDELQEQPNEEEEQKVQIVVENQDQEDQPEVQNPADASDQILLNDQQDPVEQSTLAVPPSPELPRDQGALTPRPSGQSQNNFNFSNVANESQPPSLNPMAPQLISQASSGVIQPDSGPATNVENNDPEPEKVIIEKTQAPKLSEDQQKLVERVLIARNIDQFLSSQTFDILEHIHKQNFKIIEEQYPSLYLSSDQEQTFHHLARGGLRGLQVLSLAECRNVSDAGIAKLAELKYLKKLNLLGCTKIEDEGVKMISQQFQFIQDLDLGGTNITATGLRDLVLTSKKLKTCSIMGCKKLNNSDDQILSRKGIVSQGVDDVFRFHLLPELISSDLPQITKSVLKTRSTLGLNKVYKYLLKRLQYLNVENLRNENDEAGIINENLDSIVPEEKIEILCNGQYLKPTLLLKDVKEQFWQGPFEDPAHNSDLLILHYRRKFSKNESMQIKMDLKYQKNREESVKQDALSTIVQKPQISIPKHLGFACQNPNCNKQLQKSIFKPNTQQINCMRCGNCFCNLCCSSKIRDTEFGFSKEIKVCKSCLEEVQQRNQQL